MNIGTNFPARPIPDLSAAVELATQLFETLPEEGERLARAIIQDAGAAGDRQAALEAWRLLGFARIAAAEYEGALEVFLDASEDLVARFGMARRPLEFLNGIGCAYHHLGLYTTAVSYLEDAKSEIVPETPPRSTASALNNLGLVYRAQGDSQAAERELVAALAACDRAGMGDCALSIRLNLTSIMRENGFVERARQELYSIIAACPADIDTATKASAFDSLAECHMESGEFDQALESGSRAIAIFRRLGAERDLAEGLRNRAAILKAAGRFSEALEAADVALASPGAREAVVRAPLLETKARSLEELGLWKEACGAWREYMAADPRDALSRSRSEILDRTLDQQRQSAELLQKQLRHKAEEMTRAHETVIDALAGASEAKDDVTGEHIRRSSRYVASLVAVLMARSFPGLDRGKAELYASTARLHDIGKVGIPDAILQKPGPLDADEWAIIKQHPEIGERMIRRAAWQDVGAEYSSVALEVIGAHHERWDGTGYPRGLKGAAIPLGGRIMSIADVYDAMRSRRPYKPALGHEQAVAFILGQSGTQFDPAMCDAFSACAAEFEKIFEST